MCMMSTKRVILADGPRLLREMLFNALSKADQLEVVRELPNDKELSGVIQMNDPEWVIVPTSFNDHSHSWIQQYPSVRFIFLSPTENYIKMKWQMSREENYSNLSLKDLIHILEKDLQRT